MRLCEALWPRRVDIHLFIVRFDIVARQFWHFIAGHRRVLSWLSKFNRTSRDIGFMGFDFDFKILMK